MTSATAAVSLTSAEPVSRRKSSTSSRRSPGGEPEQKHLRGRLRGASADQGPHQAAQVVAGDVDQVTLGDVVPPAQPGPAHAAAIEQVRERPLAQHRTQQERDPGHAGEQPHPVGVDRARGLGIAVPAQHTPAGGLGDAGPPRAGGQALEDLARVVALVGDHLGRGLGRGRQVDRREVAGGRRERRLQGLRVAGIAAAEYWKRGSDAPINTHLMGHTSLVYECIT